MPRELIWFVSTASCERGKFIQFCQLSSSTHITHILQACLFVPMRRKSIVRSSRRQSLPSSSLIRTRFVYFWTIYTPEVVHSRVKQFLDSSALPSITTFLSFCKPAFIMPSSFYVSKSSVRCSSHWRITIGATRQHPSLSTWFWPSLRREHMRFFRPTTFSVSARAWCRWSCVATSRYPRSGSLKRCCRGRRIKWVFHSFSSSHTLANPRHNFILPAHWITD